MGPDAETGKQAELTRRGALGHVGAALAVASGIAGLNQVAAAAQDAPSTPAAATSDPVPPDFKVVFHAAQSQHWPYILSNLRNLTQEWPQAQLRVVVDGSAVYPLQGQNAITDELAKMQAAGVELEVCPNALREHQIDPSTIPTYASTSLGGVVALVQAVHEGFTYIKP
jgi:intracellular sulfur oxidation DsrE/DsrF family protein